MKPASSSTGMMADIWLDANIGSIFDIHRGALRGHCIRFIKKVRKEKEKNKEAKGSVYIDLFIMIQDTPGSLIGSSLCDSPTNQKMTRRTSLCLNYVPHMQV